jgi:hypothetical protein
MQAQSGQGPREKAIGSVAIEAWRRAFRAETQPARGA